MPDKRPSKKSASQHSSPEGGPARRAALKLIDAVLNRGESLDHARNAVLKSLPAQADRALALAIAQELFRHKSGLDELIDSATRNRLNDDAMVRHVLGMMLVQVLKLNIAPHAVIATGLDLLSGGPRRLAHGVFSTLLKQGAQLPPAQLPDPVSARWLEKWGEEMVVAANGALANAPPLDLMLKNAEEIDIWLERLGGESLAAGHIRLPRGTAVEDLPGFAEGAWWVQDLAATMAVRLLGAGNGRAVLDLCAAPGGKTMQLASQGWQVTALDNSKKRMKRLAQNLARTELKAELIVKDALKFESEARYDAILIDAPCSASGIFRRHPDVLWRIGARDIAERAKLQQQILARASQWLKPGGQLVYAVCSLEPEEGDQRIDQLLAEHPNMQLSAAIAGNLPEYISAAVPGGYHLHPGLLAEKGGMDGFYIASLQAQ